MNSNIARAEWQQWKGVATTQWGQLTGNHLSVSTGRHLQLVGRLHAACARSKDEVGRQIDAVLRRSRQSYAGTGL
jgi:uncharacterized protein YjbJ (UPF0337 family)